MYLKLFKENIEEIKKYKNRPFYTYISISNLCNANCMFCDIHEKKEVYCSLDVYDLLDQLKEMGTKYIHFNGGGEPFVNKDILKYFEYATKLNLNIIFTTNGYALNENIIKRFREYNVKAILFSIDSYKAEIHNKIRGVKGIFEKATNNIKIIKKICPDIKIVINHVLNNKNIDSIKEFIHLKKELPYDFINPIVVKECPEYYFSDKQVKNYNISLKEIKDLMKENNVFCLYDDMEYFKEEMYENDGSDFSKNKVPCFCLQYCSFIDCVSGNVYPCDCSVHRDENYYSLGNLKEHSFKEIWESERANYLKDVLSSEVSNCKSKCDYANVMFNERVV